MFAVHVNNVGLALLEDAGCVWHHDTLEETCKPAWARIFVPMNFIYHPGRNPKPCQTGLGSPNQAHLILLMGKKKKFKPKSLPLGEFPKQTLSFGSPRRNRKAPRGFPSACLDEDPQQRCSQGKRRESQGATSASL